MGPNEWDADAQAWYIEVRETVCKEGGQHAWSPSNEDEGEA